MESIEPIVLPWERNSSEVIPMHLDHFREPEEVLEAVQKYLNSERFKRHKFFEVHKPKKRQWYTPPEVEDMYIDERNICGRITEVYCEYRDGRIAKFHFRIVPIGPLGMLFDGVANPEVKFAMLPRFFGLTSEVVILELTSVDTAVNYHDLHLKK